MKRILCVMLIMLMLCSSFVYAGENDLTLADAVKKATQSSLEVMKYTNAVVRYQRDYADSLASSRQIEDMLELDRRFRKLSLKYDRTPMEEAQFQMLSEMLRRYMGASERLNMEIASELTPKNMEYMMNVNKALLKSAKENIYLSIYQQFNNITKAEDAIKIKNALVSNLDNNYKTATAKFAQGKLSLNSLNEIKLDLQKAKIELNTLQIERKKRVIELNKTLGNPIEYQYSSYINENVPDNIQIKALQEYINTAYQNNDDYKAAKQYLEIKKREYDLVTGLYVYDTNLDNMNAYVEYNSAKDQFEATDLGLQLRVINSFTKLQNQLTALEKSKLALALNEKRLLEVKSRYKLGQTTELEVSEAYVNYNKSQLDYLSVKRDTWLAKLNLDLICGTAANNN